MTIPLLIFLLRRSRARKVPRRGPISNLVPVMDELKRATRLYFIQKRNPTKFGEVIPESPQNVFFISRAVPQGGQVRRLVPGLVPRHEPHFFDCSWVVLPILPLSVSGQVKTNRGSVSTALCAVCCVRVANSLRQITRRWLFHLPVRCRVAGFPEFIPRRPVSSCPAFFLCFGSS